MSGTESGCGPAPVAPTQPGLRRLGRREDPDPYLWMRDPSALPRLVENLAAERDFYDRCTSGLSPLRRTLSSRGAARLPDVTVSPVWTVAGAAHLLRWQTHHEYPQLVRRRPGGEQEVLLDTESLTTTGFLRLGECALSPDGRWLAYSVDVTGDEEYGLRNRDLATGVDVTVAAHTYYGLVWRPDSTGYLYVRHDESYRPHQVWMHALDGRPDRLVLEEQDARFHLSLRASGGGTHAVVRAAARRCSEEWLLPLGEPQPEPVPTFGRAPMVDYTVEPSLDGTGDRLLVVTDVGNEEFRLLEGPRGAELAGMTELLAGGAGRRLEHVSRVGSHVLVTGREDGHVRLWALSQDRSLPPVVLDPDEVGGTLRREPYDADGDDSVCLATESRRTPPVYYSVSMATGARREITRQPLGAHDPEDYLLEALSVAVTDGTLVPVTVLRHRDVPLDGTAPCLLYGYGAWETVIEPQFEPVLLSLLDAGMVFAHAHVRGGGELGRAWWLGGRMDTKQRTFADFVDVADALARGLVDGTRVVARGLSAGGLLAGAAYSQRPTRWCGVVAESPFVDPVTTMADERAPLVVVEREEWGDPLREEDRAWMLAYSPYDNVPPAPQRPPLLVTSAVHDPRVSVWEPARWVARLRASGSTSADTLFRPDLGARGHWPPPGRHAALAYESEILAWVAQRMALPSP